jgi:hypothetical protein
MKVTRLEKEENMCWSDSFRFREKKFCPYCGSTYYGKAGHPRCPARKKTDNRMENKNGENAK